ncbi:MAG: hypothetical protein MUO89_10275 [Dehalococcoidia bacterium]|nr:hypothetical protein [Dehalococcoidia bacterium]
MRHKSMYYTLLLLGIILVIPQVGCAGNQGPALQWSHTFNDGGGYSAQQTIDGAYILYGPTLIKTDTGGNKIWNKAFKNGWGFLAQQTKDGGYIICGYISFDGADGDNVWLIKTDANGNKLWDEKFGDKDRRDRIHSIQQTTDGGYVMCGETAAQPFGHYDIWLIKTDANGNKLWDKTFGDERDDIGNSVQQTKDGGYIVCGETRVSSDYSGSVWLIKTDADGNKLWDKIFDGEAYDLPDLCYYVRSVQQTTDGGYIVCGTEDKRSIKAGSYNAWLMKTDAAGNKMWDKRFGGRKDSYGHAVQETAGGGYVICGSVTTQRFGPWSKTAIWLIKTDADGNMLWDGTFSGNGQAGGNSVQQTADGGYIVCGDTRSRGAEGYSTLLLKIAPE